MKRSKIACLCSLLSLPSVSVFSIACGGNNVEQIEMVDVLNYESKIEPLAYDGKWKDKDSATNEYIEKVRANQSIFTDDMLCSAKTIMLSRGYKAYEGEGLTLTKATCGIGKATFGMTKSWIRGKEDVEHPTISFKQKIHLEYDSPAESTVVSKHIDVDMEYEYHDMIFTLCEDIISEGGGWNIGFFDWNIDEECLWPTIRNVNTWSINYNTNVYKTTTYHSGDDRPDIDIHNNSYYTGVINDAVSLSNMLNGGQDASTIESLGINFILLGEDDKYHQGEFSRFFKSNYFSKIVYKPDVRCWSQLTAYNQIGNNEVRQLRGLQLIFPENMTNEVDFDRLKGVTLNSDNSLILAESDGDDRVIEIKPTDLFLLGGGARFNELVGNPTILLSKPFTSAHEDGEIVTFLLPTGTMPLTIHFKYHATGAEDTVKVGCQMLYDNLALGLHSNN